MRRFEGDAVKPRQIAVGIIILGLAVLIYGVSRPLKRSGQTSNCQSNLKQIGLGMMQYARDYDEQFPITKNWAEGLRPYLFLASTTVESTTFKQLFRCPTTDSYYAINVYYAQISAIQDKSPRNSPLVFDVRNGRINQSDNGTLWATPPIHKPLQTTGNNVLFADGHVELRINKPRFRAFAPYKPAFGEVPTEEMLRRRRQKSTLTPKPTPRAKKKGKP